MVHFERAICVSESGHNVLDRINYQQPFKIVGNNSVIYIKLPGASYKLGKEPWCHYFDDLENLEVFQAIEEAKKRKEFLENEKK